MSLWSATEDAWLRPSFLISFTAQFRSQEQSSTFLGQCSALNLAGVALLMSFACSIELKGQLTWHALVEAAVAREKQVYHNPTYCRSSCRKRTAGSHDPTLGTWHPLLHDLRTPMPAECCVCFPSELALEARILDSPGIWTLLILRGCEVLDLIWLPPIAQQAHPESFGLLSELLCAFQQECRYQFSTSRRLAQIHLVSTGGSRTICIPQTPSGL